MISDSKFIQSRNSESTFNQKPSKLGDPLPAGTLVKFVIPNGVTYEGKIAGKSNLDYIVEVQPGESYLIPPGKLQKLNTSIVEIKKAVVKLPKISILSQPSIQMGNRCMARIAYKYKKPSDNELIAWANKIYPNLKVVDAIPDGNRKINLVFEINADKEAAEDVKPQGGDQDIRGKGLARESIPGTGEIGNKVISLKDVILNRPIQLSEVIAQSLPSYAPASGQWKGVDISGLPAPSQAEIDLYNSGIHDQAFNEYRRRTNAELGQAAKVFSEQVGPIPTAMENISQRAAQLGNPGDAEKYDSLIRAARWILARFNDSNVEYIAIPESPELAGDNNDVVVRLPFILNKKDGNNLNHIYMTRDGTISDKAGPESIHVAGYVQVDTSNLPMVMIDTPNGSETVQELGFKLSAVNSLFYKIAYQQELERNYKTTIYKKIATVADMALRAYYTVPKDPKLREILVNYGAMDPLKTIDDMSRVILTNKQLATELESYFDISIADPVTDQEILSLVQSGRPDIPVSPYEFGETMELFPEEVERAVKLSFVNLNPEYVEGCIVRAKIANYDACAQLASDVLSEYGEYSAEVQSDFESRLIKLGVDPKAKKYWTDYFKDYGKAWVRDIPRKKHNKKQASFRKNAIDEYAKKYWTDYFASGVYDDSWYGQLLIRDIPRRNHNAKLQSAASKIASDYKSYIEKEKGKYCVKSRKNKDWSGGCYNTREKAEERLKQVEMFKHMAIISCLEQEKQPTIEHIFSSINNDLIFRNAIKKCAIQPPVKRPPITQKTRREPSPDFGAITNLAQWAIEAGSEDPQLGHQITSIVVDYIKKYPDFLYDRLGKEHFVDMDWEDYVYILSYALAEKPRLFKRLQKDVNKWYSRWRKQRKPSVEEPEEEGKKLEKEKKPEIGVSPEEVGPTEPEIGMPPEEVVFGMPTPTPEEDLAVEEGLTTEIPTEFWEEVMGLPEPSPQQPSAKPSAPPPVPLEELPQELVTLEEEPELEPDLEIIEPGEEVQQIYQAVKKLLNWQPEGSNVKFNQILKESPELARTLLVDMYDQEITDQIWVVLDAMGEVPKPKRKKPKKKVEPIKEEIKAPTEIVPEPIKEEIKAPTEIVPEPEEELVEAKEPEEVGAPIDPGSYKITEGQFKNKTLDQAFKSVKENPRKLFPILQNYMVSNDIRYDIFKDFIEQKAPDLLEYVEKSRNRFLKSQKPKKEEPEEVETIEEQAEEFKLGSGPFKGLTIPDAINKAKTKELATQLFDDLMINYDKEFLAYMSEAFPDKVDEWKKRIEYAKAKAIEKETAKSESMSKFGSEITEAWKNFWTSNEGKNKGNIRILESFLKQKFGDLVSVNKHENYGGIAIVTIRDDQGKEEYFGVPLRPNYANIKEFFEVSGEKEAFGNRVLDLIQAAKLDPNTLTPINSGTVKVARKMNMNKSAIGPWSYNGPGKDDKKDYDHKKIRIQPARNRMKFEVTRMYSTTSSSDNGYIIMEIGWDPDVMQDMGDRNIMHQVISFVKGLESDKYWHDFGIFGRPRILEFDTDAGVARVKVRSSETRNVMTLSYEDDTSSPTRLEGIR